MLCAKLLTYSIKLKTPRHVCHAHPTLSQNQLGYLLIRWYDLSYLFKVSNYYGINRKGVCNFLTVNNNSFGPILLCFRHNCIAMCKTRWFHTPKRHLTRRRAMLSPNLCSFYVAEICIHGLASAAESMSVIVQV